MPRRWTPDEDRYLVQYYDGVGASHISEDMDRTASAVALRAKALKASGAWEAYRSAQYHRLRAVKLAGHVRGGFQQQIHADALVQYAPKIGGAS